MAVWVNRRGKKEIWHQVLDMWDTTTFCGLPVGLKFECMRERPSGERCKVCESLSPDRASDREAAPTAG